MRYEPNETIVGVFRDVTQSSVELTDFKKIWGILMGVFQAIAEAFNYDRDKMMSVIISINNRELNLARRALEALQLAT